MPRKAAADYTLNPSTGSTLPEPQKTLISVAILNPKQTMTPLQQSSQESHVSTGAYSILESPTVYDLFENMVGAHKMRMYFIRTCVRPFPGARILDIGCGTGTILDYLPENVEYVGYDLNAQYISLAQRKRSGRGDFICARVDEIPVPTEEDNRFDFVLAIGILHHLNDNEAATLIRAAYHHLKPGGHLASIDCCYHSGQSRLAKFLISRDRGKAVRTPAAYKKLVSSHFSPVDTSIATDLYRIPYSCFTMRAAKLEAPKP